MTELKSTLNVEEENNKTKKKKKRAKDFARFALIT